MLARGALPSSTLQPAYIGRYGDQLNFKPILLLHDAGTDALLETLLLQTLARSARGDGGVYALKILSNESSITDGLGTQIEALVATLNFHYSDDPPLYADGHHLICNPNVTLASLNRSKRQDDG
eukprot:1073664-Prymnesium_polylepis.1